MENSEKAQRSADMFLQVSTYPLEVNVTEEQRAETVATFETTNFLERLRMRPPVILLGAFVDCHHDERIPYRELANVDVNLGLAVAAGYKIVACTSHTTWEQGLDHPRPSAVWTLIRK